MTTVGTVQLIATIDTSSYKRGAKEIEKANSDIESSADKSSKNATNAWSTGAKLATAAVLAATALMVKSFINSGSEIQSLRASFESLTGSVNSTNDVMTTLYDLSKKTAFKNKDIQAAGRNYLAAGVAVEDLQRILSNTADIAGATGADLGQLTLPLTQTIARGKLQTQDFYQILNSGAGALRKPLTELAGKKGFGSLAQAMEASAITSDDLLTIMGQVTKKGGFAFQGAIKQSETFAGRMSNLQEAVTNVGLSILGVDAVTGTVDPSGIFAKLSDTIKIATGWLTDNKEELTKFGTALEKIFNDIWPVIQTVAKVFGDLIIFISNNTWVIEALAIAFVSIKTAMFLNGAQAAFEGVMTAAGGSYTVLAATMASPIVLTIAVGAALIAIGLVYDAAQKALGAMDSMYQAKKNMIEVQQQEAILYQQQIKDNPIGSAKAINAKANLIFTGLNSNDLKQAYIRLMNRTDIDQAKKDAIAKNLYQANNLPRMAEGGIVSKATLAVIGEGKEPEAVLPLSKLDKLMQNNGSTGTSQQITQNNTINTELDMEVVTRNLTWQLRRA